MNKRENVVKRVTYSGGSEIRMDVVQEDDKPTLYIIEQVANYDNNLLMLAQDEAVELFDFLADALGHKTARNS